MTTAFYIGRFQPLHKAHLGIIRQISEDNDRIIIGIGSAQYFDKENNPFTSDERKKMIEKVLRQEMIHNYEVIAIPDIHDDDRWVEHVKKITGVFDKVYTMNKLVKDLFEAKNVEVVWLEEIKGFSSTEVRKRIAKDEHWEELVPPIIAEELNKINGVERIKKLVK